MLIEFEEETQVKLALDDFKFAIKGRDDFDVSLVKNLANKQYQFLISFKLRVDAGTELKVNITAANLYIKAGSQLLNYSFAGQLGSYSPPVISQTATAVLNSTGAATKAAVTSSIGASIMSNPSAAWALLNTIQILIFLPLGTTSLSPTMIAFFDSFSGYNLIPNSFSFFIGDQDMNEPYYEARRYGISTSVFLINFGLILGPFILGILIWPFIKLISKLQLGKISKIAENKLKSYKYNYFIRFWIQAYLEAGIYAIINIHEVKPIQNPLHPASGYINLLLSTLFAVKSI